MKILFISNALGPDYLNDTVFHGGKTLLGHDLYESKRLWYMYDDLINKGQLYGRGFTLFGKINSNEYTPLSGDLTELIKNKFFDKIIYGSIWRCDDFIKLVLNTYDKKDIIFIDGEDHTDIKHELVGKGMYFKREYISKVDGVYPIGFGIPENLILDKVGEKTKILSNIVPNFVWDYNYTNEEEYYNEYSTSWYAITMKKMGWDCLRHYEIMMNGCVPLFNNLEECPELILTTLPKAELIKMFSYKEPNLEFNEFILDYTKHNLTTKHVFEKLLN
jgi:hypothetical protein